MRNELRPSTPLALALSILALAGVAGCQSERTDVDLELPAGKGTTGSSGQGGAGGGGGASAGEGGGVPAALLEACEEFCALDDDLGCEMPLCEEGCLGVTDCVPEHAALYECYAGEPEQIACDGAEAVYDVPVEACATEEDALGACLP